ncbi:MAG: hypothetical protein R6V55_08610 [Desulfovermiculus sp.]
MSAAISASNGAMEQIGAVAQQQQSRTNSSLRMHPDGANQDQSHSIQRNGLEGDSVSLSQASMEMLSPRNEGLNGENMGDNQRNHQRQIEQNQPVSFSDQGEPVYANEQMNGQGINALI